MRRLALAAAFCAIGLPVLAADEPPQAAMMSKAMAELQQQRNRAQDDAVNAKVEAGIYADRLAQIQQQLKAAQDKIAELEKPAAPKPEAKESPK
jgi:hypothetical protein